MDRWHNVVQLFIIGMWTRAWTTMRSMTLLPGSFSSVSYASIESAEVDWTWLWVRVLILRWMHAFEFQNYIIIFLWEVIYVHFYNWDRPLDLVLVVYDLIEFIIGTSLWTKNSSTFDTHTQHTRLLINECLFHLCDCTCSNVMCILNFLTINSKKIFECLYVFESVFILLCFVFLLILHFTCFSSKTPSEAFFARSSRVSSSHEIGLGKKWKHQISNKNSHGCQLV